jgi:hypothetical protein
MADQQELQQRLERIRHWAQSQSEMFRDGDIFLLRCEGAEVNVEETPLSRFRALHPRLFGRLASLEAQLENGCLLYFLACACPGLVSLGLHLHWFDSWLDARLAADLDAWWFFLALFAATGYVVKLGYELVRRHTYRRQRAELFELIGREGLERDTLVPLLDGADELICVIRQLKLDSGPFPEPPPSHPED